VKQTKQLIEGAVNGMLVSLDPHSAYLTPELYKELQVETKGSFGGLGIEITNKSGMLTVVAPIEDTPAYRAGIKSGDIILKIDGEFTKDMTLVEAVKRMRGKPDTKVRLTIKRENPSQLFDTTLTREVIKIMSVKSKPLEKGYAATASRSSRSAPTTTSRRPSSTRQEMGGIQGVVLDLRNNPGGLLTQAVKVSDMFLDTGLIVYTDGRLENQKQKYFAHKPGTYSDFPMVVLVNGGSASASEIVAGALQDHKRALVLGTTTFGKGSVQTILPLDENSALRLTTARYFTPNGRSIQATGIVPDITMDQGVAREEEKGRQWNGNKSSVAPLLAGPAAPPRAPNGAKPRPKKDDDSGEGSTSRRPRGVKEGSSGPIPSSTARSSSSRVAGLQDVRRGATPERAVGLGVNRSTPPLGFGLLPASGIARRIRLDLGVGRDLGLQARGDQASLVSLKDDRAQLDAVMFRKAAQALVFEPVDGTEVVALGKVSIWPERGRLQIYVSHMEPMGLGALRLAFEQLKARLAAEGLFDQARKRPLPRAPRAIGIVTALQGAAIQDMLRVLRDRWPAARVVVRPARVQGQGAAVDVAIGIYDVQRVPDVDVVIVGRGGGSLEDLWAFNEEAVARAIVACRVPVVSAVGHEIDFTIADFAADVRAPTPTAAASLVVPDRQDAILVGGIFPGDNGDNAIERLRP
jgi:carboxyl-terminal processing protease